MRHIDTKIAREFAEGGDRYTGAEVRVWVHDLCDNLDALRAALERIAGRCDTEAAYKIARTALGKKCTA